MRSDFRGHRVKGSARGYLPGRIVTVTVATAPEADRGPNAVAQPHRFRAAHVSVSHRYQDRYSAPSRLAFRSPEEWWDWLEGPRSSGRRTLVFSPVASDSLTLLRLWHRWDGLGARWAGAGSQPNKLPPVGRITDAYTVSRCVLRGRPDIVEYSIAGRKFRWTSCRNYFRDSEDKVATATGYQWASRAEGDDSDPFICSDPADLCGMWHHAITTLVLWWRTMEAGRFPSTMPQMGFQFLRSRMGDKAPITHANPDAIKLERLCCHGGRATAWFTGDIRPRGRYTPADKVAYPSSGGAILAGPIHLVDVRSMYPHLMREYQFPVKIAGTLTDALPSDVADLLPVYDVLARVTLNTEIAEYPHRTGERIIYPVGRFTAHLATPELRSALSEGAVERVHFAAYYYRGRPYASAADQLLRMRSAARVESRSAWESFVKGLTNSMTGKLAQRKGEWVEATHVEPRVMWGEWLDHDYTTGTTLRYQCRAGLVWRLDRSERGTGTLTAGYAVLTAYGRHLMREVRSSLPAKSVLSQDTDGMWVTDAALRRLNRDSERLGPLPGLLRVVRSVPSARFWTARHYFAGGSWIVAGLSSPSFVPGTSSFEDHASVNPVRFSPLAPPDVVVRQTRTGTLEAIISDGDTGADGWLTPYRLPRLLHKPERSAPPQQGTLFD